MADPLSDNTKESVCHKFDSYCKKVLRNTVIKYINEVLYLSKHEVNFSDLPPNVYPMSTNDEYFLQSRSFETSIGSIIVNDPNIAETIPDLPDIQREIILLYYIAEKTDKEIGEILKMPRSTVRDNRYAAIKFLKKIMEDKLN